MTTNGMTVPEEGRLVEVRNRQWVVADCIPSSLPPDFLAGETERQHLLTLTSVEDDALGEELRVIWEAEVGRRVEPPDRAVGAGSGQAGASSHLRPSTGDDTRCSTRTLAA